MMKTTNFHRFMQNAIGPDVDILEIADRFGDRVFTENLYRDLSFKQTIADLLPHAVATAIGYPKNIPRSRTRRRISDIIEGRDRRFPGQEQIMLVANSSIEMIGESLQENLCFVLSGGRTFVFEGDLSERMMHTNIDIPLSLLNMPMRSFQVVHETDRVKESVKRLFNAAFPDRATKVDIEKIDSICMSISELNTEIYDVEDKGVLIRCAINGVRSDGYDDDTFTFHVDLPDDPDMRLPDVVEKAVRNAPESVRSAGDLHMRSFSRHAEEVIRLAVNSVLYLTSMNADIGDVRNDRRDLLRKSAAQGLPAGQRKRAANAALTAADIDYAEVGRIYRSSKFNGNSPSATDPDAEGTGRKLSKRVVVSGHYRQQAYGPGRTERRIIFIEPYVKGPDAAEMISRAVRVPDMDRAIPDEDTEMSGPS